MATEMTDRELIGYMDAHSRTPRALFRNDYCKRLQELAGVSPTGDDDEWYAWHHEDIKPYLDEARRRLNMDQYLLPGL